MKALHDKVDSADRGTALLELALTLPVLMIIIAGIVSWWHVLWKQDLILMATRHGARAAAAVSREREVSGDLEAACSDTSGTTPALSAAVGLAHRYLVVVGLENSTCVPSGTPTRSCVGSAYTVSASFVTTCEDGFGKRAIRVAVSSNDDIHCVLCYERIFERVGIVAESTFAAEANCSSLGVLTCP